MKKMFLITFAIMLSINLFAQRDEFPSKEEDEYYKNLRHSFRRHIFRHHISTKPLNFKPEYYKIEKTKLDYEPYLHEKYLMPSLNSMLERISFYDSTMQGIEYRIERIGNISKSQIIKYEKRDSIEAFIYESAKYENLFFGEPGIWIGYSENNGKDWNYYYTGIVQRQPVYIKYYSQRPLIKEKGVLEIDACLLKQLTPFVHPGPGPKYKCVKDGIYVVLDMDIISKDSDGDGLTDIVEDKFYTNKYHKDTDRDGIPDNLDTNPRVYYPRTEKSKIYEAILDSNIEWTYNSLVDTGKIIFKEDFLYVTDLMETRLIVTDNEDLMGIQPGHRVIFMTRKEYKKISKGYSTQLERESISPLFKVDGMEDTYKISKSIGTGGFSYLIRKTEEGWIIERLSSWIS